MSSGTKLTATNTFGGGLIMDFSPDNTKNTLLTGALNATLITFNGNEYNLQNDFGNGRVETAYLPEGYIPVGTCELGGIIYIASYNPLTNKSQLGSFPSPERNITSEEVGGASTKIDFNDFFNTEDLYYLEVSPTGGLTIKSGKQRNVITSTNNYKITEKILHPGDYFYVYSNEDDIENNARYLNNISPVSNSPVFDLKLVTLDKNNKFEELEVSKKSVMIGSTNGSYIIGEGEPKSIGDPDIDTYRDMLGNYDVFTAKSSGNLYTQVSFMGYQQFSPSIDISTDSSNTYYFSIKGSAVDYSGTNIDINEIDALKISVGIDPTTVSTYYMGSRFTESEKWELKHNNNWLSYFIEKINSEKIDSNITTIRDLLESSSLGQMLYITLTPGKYLDYTYSSIDSLGKPIVDTIEYAFQEDLSTTISIDLSKLGKGTVDLAKWRYYNEDESFVFNFEVQAFPYPGRSVESIEIKLWPYTNSTNDYDNFIKWDYSTLITNGGFVLIYETSDEIFNKTEYITYDLEYNTGTLKGTLKQYVLYLAVITITVKDNNTNAKENFEIPRWLYTCSVFNEDYLAGTEDFSELKPILELEPIITPIQEDETISISEPSIVSYYDTNPTGKDSDGSGLNDNVYKHTTEIDRKYSFKATWKLKEDYGMFQIMDGAEECDLTVKTVSSISASAENDKVTTDSNVTISTPTSNNISTLFGNIFETDQLKVSYTLSGSIIDVKTENTTNTILSLKETINNYIVVDYQYSPIQIQEFRPCIYNEDTLGKYGMQVEKYNKKNEDGSNDTLTDYYIISYYGNLSACGPRNNSISCDPYIEVYDANTSSSNPSINTLSQFHTFKPSTEVINLKADSSHIYYNDPNLQTWFTSNLNRSYPIIPILFGHSGSDGNGVLRISSSSDKGDQAAKEFITNKFLDDIKDKLAITGSGSFVLKDLAEDKANMITRMVIGWSENDQYYNWFFSNFYSAFRKFDSNYTSQGADKDYVTRRYGTSGYTLAILMHDQYPINTNHTKVWSYYMKTASGNLILLNCFTYYYWGKAGGKYPYWQDISDHYQRVFANSKYIYSIASPIFNLLTHIFKYQNFSEENKYIASEAMYYKFDYQPSIKISYDIATGQKLETDSGTKYIYNPIVGVKIANEVYNPINYPSGWKSENINFDINPIENEEYQLQLSSSTSPTLDVNSFNSGSTSIFYPVNSEFYTQEMINNNSGIRENTKDTSLLYYLSKDSSGNIGVKEMDSDFYFPNDTIYVGDIYDSPSLYKNIKWHSNEDLKEQDVKDTLGYTELKAGHYTKVDAEEINTASFSQESLQGIRGFQYSDTNYINIQKIAYKITIDNSNNNESQLVIATTNSYYALEQPNTYDDAKIYIRIMNGDTLVNEVGPYEVEGFTTFRYSNTFEAWTELKLPVLTDNKYKGYTIWTNNEYGIAVNVNGEIGKIQGYKTSEGYYMHSIARVLGNYILVDTDTQIYQIEANNILYNFVELAEKFYNDMYGGEFILFNRGNVSTSSEYYYPLGYDSGLDYTLNYLDELGEIISTVDFRDIEVLANPNEFNSSNDYYRGYLYYNKGGINGIYFKKPSDGRIPEGITTYSGELEITDLTNIYCLSSYTIQLYFSNLKTSGPASDTETAITMRFDYTINLIEYHGYKKTVEGELSYVKGSIGKYLTLKDGWLVLKDSVKDYLCDAFLESTINNNDGVKEDTSWQRWHFNTDLKLSDMYGV